MKKKRKKKKKKKNIIGKMSGKGRRSRRRDRKTSPAADSRGGSKCGKGSYSGYVADRPEEKIRAHHL